MSQPGNIRGMKKELAHALWNISRLIENRQYTQAAAQATAAIITLKVGRQPYDCFYLEPNFQSPPFRRSTRTYDLILEFDIDLHIYLLWSILHLRIASSAVALLPTVQALVEFVQSPHLKSNMLA